MEGTRTGLVSADGRMLKKYVGLVMGTVLAVVFIPILVLAFASFFVGPWPLVGLGIVYYTVFSWPFMVTAEFGDHVDYQSVIERSFISECSHVALELSDGAQAQPYAVRETELDWQPERAGWPEHQPDGAKLWKPTPIDVQWASDLKREMIECGLSADTVDLATQALGGTGSWMTYNTRGGNGYYIYSRPLEIALRFAIEH